MTGRIIACGLGPAGADLVTTETAELLTGSRPVVLRTARHPAAAELAPEVPSYDDVYDQGSTFAEVYRRIAEDLVARAEGDGEVVYVVPGSPRVLERTVELLAEEARDGRVALEVRPALSFLDLTWVRLGLDPVEEGVRLVDGHRFATAAAGERGPLLVAHCHNRRVLSEVKLAVEEPPAEPVLVLQRLGCPDETITEVAWADLDRSVEPDHLTSLWIPQLTAPVASELVAFTEVVRTLRQSCPWDRAQTHGSLSRYALEEAYEVVEAISAWEVATEAETAEDAVADAEEHLAEELGDLLFQVVFHATLGAERGAFDLAEVARGIHDKLVRRHPHVFPPEGGELAPDDVESITRTWEEIKRAETGRRSVMDGIPDALPSLLWAHKVLRKAEAAGHPWVPTLAADEVVDADALGERLLALVEAARAAEIDPESALRVAAARVRDRVLAAEAGTP